MLGSNSYSNPPPAPVGLSATATSTTAKVTWTRNKAVAGYLAIVYTATGGLATYHFVTGNNCTFEGLRPSSTYQVIVASVTKGGNTGSDRAIFTTLTK